MKNQTTTDNLIIRCAFDKLEDPNTLQPHPRNANKHGPRQLEIYAKIIKFQGFRRPITVSKRSGFITRGHGMLEAALIGGIISVPVDYQDYDSEEQELADLIADNQLATLAEIDRSQLKANLLEIDAGEIDMEITGFELSTIENMMTESASFPDLSFPNDHSGIGATGDDSDLELSESDADDEPEEETEDDEIPEIKEPRAKAGDTFGIGIHKILCGDSLLRLKEFPANHFDSVVTDPPYGLSFMGKKWDYDVPSTELWDEVMRVLKPGGHLLAFSGTRTYHRMTVNIEDAGFEVRDMLQWLYGSGFPKSQNISIQIDKQSGALEARGKAFRTAGAGDRKDIKEANGKAGFDSYEPVTELAKQWEGFGTALKPACEPVAMARKPIEKGLTIAENVLKWGTGAINIDESRIEGAFQSGWSKTGSKGSEKTSMSGKNYARDAKPDSPQGRWPANIILDEEAAAALDEQSGQLSQCGGPKKTTHDAGMFGIGTPGRIYKEENRGASRFFYVAKSSKSERNYGLEGESKPSSQEYRPNDDGSNGIASRLHGATEKGVNHHPTVKPVKLMEYLAKLVTPSGGKLLDPFSGSGSTGVAVIKHSFEFTGIELSESYCDIILARLEKSTGTEAVLLNGDLDESN